MSVNKANKLINDIENIISNSEYNTVTVKGVRNLSRSDLDTIIMYAEAYIDNGCSGYGNFMTPSDGVEKVLEKYGILVEQNKYGW